MQSGTVIKVNDVVGDVLFGFCMVGIPSLPDTLHFQIQKEPLHHGIVPAITLAAHAEYQTMVFK